MRNVYLSDKEWAESFAFEPDDDARLLDTDFFTGLCMKEVEHLCDSVNLSKLNRMLIGLHCRGLSDKEIELALAFWLPFLSTKKKLSHTSIKERRHDIVRRMKKANGTEVGLISLIADCMKKN